MGNVKHVKIRVNEEGYKRLQVLAVAFGKGNVTAFVKFIVQSELDKDPQSPPALNRAATASHHPATNTDDDLLDEPIIATGTSGKSRLQYVRHGDRVYPVHATVTSKTRMCIVGNTVEDGVLFYDIRDIPERSWVDVSNELNEFEARLIGAWIHGVDWMYPNFLKMLKETDHEPTIKDYEQLLKDYTDNIRSR